jgi:hypothetical protein
MNPRVTNVKPGTDYTLHLWFTNGEQGILDMKPWLDRGPVFRELRDPALFNAVHPDGLSIEWPNDASLCPDSVYEYSVKI